MKNPPTPDPKPDEPGPPADHNPKDGSLSIELSEQGKLEPIDGAFLHGGNNQSK